MVDGKIGNTFDVRTGLENLGHTWLPEKRPFQVRFSGQRQLGSKIKNTECSLISFFA